MSEPLTITVLDEQTKDELQPPCDSTKACEIPARWVVRYACGAPTHHVSKTVLACDAHKKKWVRQFTNGETCRCTHLHPSTPSVLTGLEPLR